MPGVPAVEAEDEFIQVGLEVLAAQSVVDAQGPDLEVGEDPVNPGEHDVGGHLADDVGIVSDAGRTGICGPTIRLGGSAGGDVGGEEGVEASGRVISDLAQADTAGAKAAVLDLDGADNQHFAVMATPTTARDRIVFAAAGDFGFIDLNQSGQRTATRREPIPRQSAAPLLVALAAQTRE